MEEMMRAFMASNNPLKNKKKPYKPKDHGSHPPAEGEEKKE